MKSLIKTSIIFFLTILSVSGFSQSEEKYGVLEAFIEMHNAQNEEVISSFIRENYLPSLYQKLDIEKQIAFYQYVINDFGQLNPRVYKVMKETEQKLIVQLIKKGESPLSNDINPTEILVVELDFDIHDKRYLSRGVGLGALVCTRVE